MRSLKDQFSKVSKKLNEQEMLIKNLKLSNAAQKKKLAQLGDNRGRWSRCGGHDKEKECAEIGKARKPNCFKTMMSGLCCLKEGSWQWSQVI